MACPRLAEQLTRVALLWDLCYLGEDTVESVVIMINHGGGERPPGHASEW